MGTHLSKTIHGNLHRLIYRNTVDFLVVDYLINYLIELKGVKILSGYFLNLAQNSEQMHAHHVKPCK